MSTPPWRALAAPGPATLLTGYRLWWWFLGFGSI
jgi:hypothetical protein